MQDETELDPDPVEYVPYAQGLQTAFENALRVVEYEPALHKSQLLPEVAPILVE